MRDLVQLASKLGVELVGLGIQAAEPVKVAEQAAVRFREVHDDGERQQLAVAQLLSRALAGMPAKIDAAAVHVLMQSWSTNLRGMVIAGALADVAPAFLEQFLDEVIALDPRMGFIVGAAAFLPEGSRARIWTQLATDPREAVRQHFFALLGRHKRLVPPGTLAKPQVPSTTLTTVLGSGLRDSSASVRERAIAVVYGLGVTDEFRDALLKLVHDDSLEVRRYALVSLGTMHDEQSLAVLVERLEKAPQPEATSAIWALSRRPDGIDRVLRLAGTHGWLDDEVLGAFAEVAVPVSDEQIADLAARTASPEFERLKQRHLDRTRGGAPEYGPDGRIRWE
ncbi:MAG TPA: HEAT repeat domain-containing protein [Kofleriaceae bacterium]|nr:HEAT repeat domain-containing protein [Kofleriaceae bacterium]